ncbi:MAG: carboxypeptidase regulatory-like domain-containing protein [Nanoarchaeota archaeon]|nr:carboxypeptidase regulatory-like domain-containing protein [Nanoarchaeota archaeon]
MGLKKRGLLLVVFLLSVVFAFSAAAEEGCYLYAGGDERLYCQSIPRETAAADCADYANCDMETHFAADQSCASTNFSECQEVTCSVDCSERPIGQCAFLGGTALTSNEETRQCGPACCIIAVQDSCTWETTLYSCVQYAQDFGLNESDAEFNTAILSESACALQCGRTVPPTGVPTEGTAQISGTVKDAAGQPIYRATVTLAGLGRSVLTAEDGSYRLIAIPAGTLTLIASSPRYAVVELQLLVEEGAQLSDINFILGSAEMFQGVTGTVYVDLNNDGIRQESEKRHGAKVSLDNVWRDDSDFAIDKSSPSYGKFTIAVGTFGEHQLSATYPGGYASEPILFTLSALQPVVPIDLFLTKTLGICAPGQPDARKKVDGFSLSPVPGEKAVQLHWQKPCPEVISYEITRQKQGETTAKPLPAASATQTTFIDADPQLEWEATYTYSIKAVYASGQDSAEPATASIELGKEACTGKFDETFGWKTFCLLEDRHQVYSCDANNELSSQACVGDTFYCAPLSAQEATCKDAGVCSIGTDPFGLYAERAACYGAETAAGGAAANFCTYDATDSVVNACKSCATINNCFDYQSQDACITNSCFTSSCQWVDSAENTQLIDYSPLLRHLELPQFVTQETGSGYCTEANYQQDDFCSLCSATATVFENFFCTADVCSSLGRCFSSTPQEPPKEPLSSCASCGDVPSRDANCYTYLTADECTGGQETGRASGPQLLFSDDQCGWQRCAWVSDAAAGEHCVKDGNADIQDDCAAVSSGERQLCRTDITPPVTAVLPDGLKVVSLNASPLTFQATDNNGVKSLWYCLTPPGQDLCTEFGLVPDGDFREVRYPGTRPAEEIPVSFSGHSLITEQAPDGETFTLKFYSLDKYANQEEVRETPVYVDVVPPQFEIAEHTEVAAGKASLTLFLEGTNEPMSCTFTLQQELPLGGMQSYTAERGQPLEATFSDLSGLLYQATVQCTDAAGNRAEKIKLIPLDTEEHITVQSPVGAIKIKNAVFSVATTVPASCELYVFDAGAFTKVTDFQTDAAGLQHSTPRIDFSGRYPEAYREIADYRVSCLDALTNERYEELFFFTIDMTPAAAQMILQGDGRTVRPQGDNWQVSFRNETRVGFECLTEAEGFACMSYFYCLAELGESCRDLPLQEYTELTAPLRLSDSASICSYTIDAGNNQPYVVRCGDVILDSYGLTLRHPPQHSYQGESWGVSAEQNFTVQFFTKVPTQECRFDFISGFSYDAVPRFKVLTPDPITGDYFIYNFPAGVGASAYPAAGGVKEVYVRCTDASGTVGSEKKVNLEYDPTAPRIVQARANPALIIEGITTNLLVDTDDKTLCRYDDAGAEAFADMKYRFPGEEQKLLRELHDDLYTITMTGLQADYTIMTQCQNGAQDFSDVASFDFTVDYTQVGNIIRLWPNGGYLTQRNLTVEVETSKNARCELLLNVTAQLMQGAGGRLHTFPLSNLLEKSYALPVRCRMADHEVENAIRFTIDRTSPQITSIEDGNYSCGSSTIAVRVYTNENNLSAYAYEVSDAGAVSFSNRTGTTSSSSSGNRTPLLNATVAAQLPLEIPITNLQEGRKYQVKVAAQDAAGNWGSFGESDGFTIVNRTYTACLAAGLPQVTVQFNESDCSQTMVELLCSDTVGCRSFLYGKSSSSASCDPQQSYSGQKLSFDAAGWLCYALDSNTGNNQSGSKHIAFSDADGDSVRDSCDACASTPAGKVVNEEGCASNQATPEEAKKDADADGLPDAWEMRHNKEGCALNSTAVDSDGDGTRDTAEDYDADGSSNLEEYTRGTDPCRAEALREEEERKIPAEKPDVIAWVFFILGWLLLLGGSGYLVYYYRFSAAGKKALPKILPKGVSLAEAIRPVFPEWQQKLAALRREREKRKKERERREVFEAFSKSSPEIPHVEPLLKKKNPDVSHLQKVAETYTAHKEEIQPGLKAQEKNVFSKLEDLAKSAKKKALSEIVSPAEAESIFNRLKDLAKKRKGK